MRVTGVSVPKFQYQDATQIVFLDDNGNQHIFELPREMAFDLGVRLTVASWRDTNGSSVGFKDREGWAPKWAGSGGTLRSQSKGS
jgi:hypothetical protein